MTCREFIDFLLEYDAGTLGPGQRASFEAHLEQCPECVQYVKSYRQTIKISKGAFAHPDEPIPADAPEALVRAILAARSKKTA